MKIYANAVLLAALGLAPLGLEAQPVCPLKIRAAVAVPGPSLTLADLLSPDTCPGFLQEAARVILGRAPLPGSTRILGAGEVRDRLEPLIRRAGDAVAVAIPERVRVVRTGGLATCNGIDAGIVGDLTECGAAGRLPRDVSIQMEKPVWDASLGRWKVVARCASPAQCVPFLIQVAGSAAEARTSDVDSRLGPRPTSPPTVRATPKNLLVLPGQEASLIWEQDGIRLSGSATCLDRGGRGDTVRARIPRSGRVVRAVVVGAGVLRAVS